MPLRTLNIPANFSKLLAKFPESGMGYQWVKVILKNGAIFPKHKVLNSSILVLEETDHFSELDILTIELEK